MDKAILGKKIGMTQIFDEIGKAVPVTIIETDHYVATPKQTDQSNGHMVFFGACGMGKTTVSVLEILLRELRNQKKRCEPVIYYDISAFSIVSTKNDFTGNSFTRRLDSLLTSWGTLKWVLSLRQCSFPSTNEGYGTSHSFRALSTYVPNKLARFTYEEEPKSHREQAGSIHRKTREIRILVRKARCFPIPRGFSAETYTLVFVKTLTALAWILSCCLFIGNRRGPAGVSLHKMYIVLLKGEMIVESNQKQSSEGGIGNVLYSVRIIEKLSVKELAERMGVASTYICDVEANRKHPSLDKIEQFSAALGVDPHTLIYFNEKGKKCRYNHKKLLLEILQEMANANA